MKNMKIGRIAGNKFNSTKLICLFITMIYIGMLCTQSVAVIRAAVSAKPYEVSIKHPVTKEYAMEMQEVNPKCRIALDKNGNWYWIEIIMIDPLENIRKPTTTQPTTQPATTQPTNRSG
jgi:hypothetical protein